MGTATGDDAVSGLGIISALVFLTLIPSSGRDSGVSLGIVVAAIAVEEECDNCDGSGDGCDCVRGKGLVAGVLLVAGWIPVE